MEWDASLETGDPAIDRQHQRLMALFNELDTAERRHGPDEVRDVFETLTEYVSTHFAMEEDLMRSHGYLPEALQAHVAEHRELTRRTRDMVIEYRSGGTELAALTAFLREWLCQHVQELDRELVEHVKRQSETG